MRSIGLWLIVLTGLSVALPMMGMQLIVLSWADSWGQTTGWIIRGGLLLLGLMLAAMPGKKK